MDQQIHKICLAIYKKCFGKAKKNNAKLAIFLHPVDLSKYPDYLTKIGDNKPMDLTTLKKQLNVKSTKSAYSTFDEFCGDARLIFENCKRYNAADPVLCSYANEVLGQFEGQVLNELPKVKERLAILDTYTFPEYEQCMTVVDQCLSFAAIKELFAKPVEVENYSLWIQTPMDLGTVKAKLTGGSYTSFSQFDRDMLLIGTNCLHFNNDPDRQSAYRDIAILYLEKYEKLKKLHLKGLQEFPLKSHLLPCRRALDLVLIMNRKDEKDDGENAIKLALPWMLRHIPKIDAASPAGSSCPPDIGSKPSVTLGDVSDKLYSLSYDNEKAFIDDLTRVLKEQPSLPGLRNKKQIDDDRKQLIHFIEVLSGLIVLPLKDGEPIEPENFSKVYPTKWFYDLSADEMIEVIDEICMKQELKALFYKPVDGNLVKDYDKFVKDKMDLSTIRARLKSGIWYYMAKQVMADIDLVATNCKTFNALFKKYVQLAKNLQQEAKNRYSKKLKDYDNRLKEEKRLEQAKKRRLAEEERNRKKALQAKKRELAEEERSKKKNKAAEKTSKDKAANFEGQVHKSDIAKNAMRKRRQSLLKNYTNAGSTKLIAKSNSGNDKKRKWDQKGPPNKKARIGPPKGPPKARISENSNGNAEFVINATAIGAPGGANVARSNAKSQLAPAYALAKKKYEDLLGASKPTSEAGPPVFKPIGQKAVYKAAAKKNRKKEKKLSPSEEKCKRIFYRLNNEVVGIESIPLNKIYFNVFGLKWSTPFIHHPLEIYPQEAFRKSYLHVVPKPIALYFSMNEENEAVYDNILKRVYRNRFDSNPSGPTIEEMFVADAERVFNNSILSNSSNTSPSAQWICMKAKHYLEFLNNLAHEYLFNEEIDRYKTKLQQQKVLRRMREEAVANLPLSDPRGFGKDRTAEFMDKVMKKLKSSQGMKITYQHWNVSKEEIMKIPGYTDVIQKAMDLSTVYDTLDTRAYGTYKAVLDDIRLCFSNAITFWGRDQNRDDNVVNAAKKSSEYFEKIWAQASLSIYEYAQREAILKKVFNQQKAEAREEERFKKRLEEAKEEMLKQEKIAKEQARQKEVDQSFKRLRQKIYGDEKDDDDVDDDSSDDSDDAEWRGSTEFESNEMIESCPIRKAYEDLWGEDYRQWNQASEKGVTVYGEQIARGGSVSM